MSSASRVRPRAELTPASTGKGGDGDLPPGPARPLDQLVGSERRIRVDEPFEDTPTERREVDALPRQTSSALFRRKALLGRIGSFRGRWSSSVALSATVAQARQLTSPADYRVTTRQCAML